MKNLLEYKGYHAKVELDTEDGVFVASVIGIADSINFHGKTYEELKEAFEVSIDDYLEMCKFFGREPDKEYKGSFNVRISPELHKNIDIEANSKGISLNQFVAEALENSLSLKREQIFITMPTEYFETAWKYSNDSNKYYGKTKNTRLKKEVSLA